MAKRLVATRVKATLLQQYATILYNIRKENAKFKKTKYFR